MVNGLNGSTKSAARPSLARWVLITLTWLGAFGSIPAFAAEGAFEVLCPEDPIVIGSSFVAHIRFDAGTRPLAAFGINLEYPTSAAVLESVAGGTTDEFASAPEADRDTFASGSTLITAVNSTSTTSPTGVVSLARVSVRTGGSVPGPISLWAIPVVAVDATGEGFIATSGACVVTLVSGPTPTPTPTPLPPVTCIGDCDFSDDVTVDELLTGIAIALGVRPMQDCLPFDSDGDGQVVVSEIVTAVNASLVGCPEPIPTPTPTVTATPTATSTPLPNEAPQLLQSTLYYASPGVDIRYAIQALDPEGGTLQYLADELPEGASLDPASGIFSWTPSEAQVGPHTIPFRVVDDGSVPSATEGSLTLQVEALSPCTNVTCDPATGCTYTLKSLAENCCPVEEQPRIPFVDAGCPEGGVFFAGRNTQGGIGRLQQCDWLRVLNFAQAGAAVRLNFEARCLSQFNSIRVRVRMQTQSRLMVDDDVGLTFFEGNNGYIERITVPFDVRGGGPFFDLDFAEANLSVTATDATGASYRTDRRVRLTFEPVPDSVDPLAPVF